MEHSVDWREIGTWLMGVLAALLGIVWKKQDNRLGDVEAKLSQHERDNTLAHDGIRLDTRQEVQRLHAKIDETRREIKSDLATVIHLLENRRQT